MTINAILLSVYYDFCNDVQKMKTQRIIDTCYNRSCFSKMITEE